MKKVEINRKDFIWGEDFYTVLKKQFNFPDWFGNNVDALWDMLTGFVETPCEITFIGFGCKENEYNGYIIKSILSCFNDVAKKYPTKYKIIYKK